MSDIQKRFDGLLALLQKNTANHALVAECYDITEGEFALTAPADNAALPNATTVANILSLGVVNTDNPSVTALIKNITDSAANEVALWYIDSDNGQYIIATTANTNALIGVGKNATTLTEIRKRYFMQKEALEKIGETLPFDYAEKENSFYNRQLIK